MLICVFLFVCMIHQIHRTCVHPFQWQGAKKLMGGLDSSSLADFTKLRPFQKETNVTDENKKKNENRKKGGKKIHGTYIIEKNMKYDCMNLCVSNEPCTYLYIFFPTAKE